MTPERRLQNKIVEAVTKFLASEDHDCEVIKLHGNMYSAGWPDLLVIVDDGSSCFIEVKVPGNKPSPRQLAKLTRIAELGVMCGVATTADEALEIVYARIDTQG